MSNLNLEHCMPIKRLSTAILLNSLKVAAIMLIGLGVLTNCRSGVENNDSLVLDASTSIKPLALRNERQSFCGVERYNTQNHSLCGVKTYRNARSAACGVELYNNQANLSCPGSIAEDIFSKSTSGTCHSAAKKPDDCPAGYENSESKREASCANRELDWKSVVGWTRTCTRRQNLASCRKTEFGVELYRSCQHANHGVQDYNSCARPEFGISSYNSCGFYLLPAEIDTYLSSVRQLLPFMGETLINAKALYYITKEDEAATACHIKKYDSDPIFQGQITELKTLYVTRYGRDFETTRFDCSTAAIPNIDTENCPDDETSRLCKNVRSYRGAKTWFEVKLTDMTNLSADIGARSNAVTAKAIQDQLIATKNYEK